MTSLKKARESKAIENFIKEHEDDPKGDLDKLDAVIKGKKAAENTKNVTKNCKD